LPSETVCKSFIEKIAPLVVAQAKARGYHVASTIIAQACCEGAYGTNWLAKEPYWNEFGMKCGGAWKGRSVSAKTKEEYSPGVLTSITDNFRAYDSLEDGVIGYFDFISWSHYAALKNCYDYRSYAETLKAKGYATSSTYVNTLCKIVEQWNLTQYDWEDTPVIPVKRPVIIFNMRGESVAEMQRALIAKGYSCGRTGADGIYGKATKEALGAYQADNGLDVDYKCGPKTWASLLA